LSLRHGLRRATALHPPKHEIESMSLEGAADEDRSPDDLPSPSPDILRFVYEPDASVLAAHLVGTLATTYDLQPLAAGCAYLTSDQELHNGLVATFEVFDQMPFDLRKVRARLRELNFGDVEIKKRGVDIDVVRLSRVLREDAVGDIASSPLTLILARRGDRVTALFTRRRQPPTY